MSILHASTYKLNNHCFFCGTYLGRQSRRVHREKISKLDSDLVKYKDQMKKMRDGPSNVCLKICPLARFVFINFPKTVKTNLAG